MEAKNTSDVENLLTKKQFKSAAQMNAEWTAVMDAQRGSSKMKKNRTCLAWLIDKIRGKL
jgi:hypothetical protein